MYFLNRAIDLYKDHRKFQVLRVLHYHTNCISILSIHFSIYFYIIGFHRFRCKTRS